MVAVEVKGSGQAGRVFGSGMGRLALGGEVGAKGTGASDKDSSGSGFSCRVEGGLVTAMGVTQHAGSGRESWASILTR